MFSSQLTTGNKMWKVRQNILPKSLGDLAAFTFILFAIPAIYWFELFVVLPTIHTTWTFWYNFHFVCGTFLMINITSNLVAIVLVDTSIIGKMMPSVKKPDWRFCAICETIAPPRSWHCSVCKTCILKRDHHCIFSACCIGFNNYRYFYMFTLYLFAATLYASYFNIYFLWTNPAFHSSITILKMLFPLATFVFGFDSSDNQCYLLLCLMSFIGTLFTFTILLIHTKLILMGTTQYENSHKLRDYDYGIEINLKMTFGKRWYIAWIFPLIYSDLPFNGIDWVKRTDMKNK